MALISLKKILDLAAEHSAAIPAFNVNNLEQIQAICEAAQEMNAPIILQASSGARSYATIPFLKGLIQGALEKYPNLPICWHQDHGHTPEICFESIRAGFSSVMMDGSLLADGKTPSSFEHNVTVTSQVVSVAHALGVSVEGEIGCLGSLETGLAGDEDGTGAQNAHFSDLLTDPEMAYEFALKTHVDALAIAIGTSHGVSKFQKPPTEETLSLTRLSEIHQRLPNMHLVLHGASTVDRATVEKINQYGGAIPLTYGVPISALQKAITLGVRKINIDTDLRLAVTAAIREYFYQHPEVFDPRSYLKTTRIAMHKICCDRLIAFGAAGLAAHL
ncbi:MAG: fructose-bisphosphate aldolase class II [Gammaproteobacteria bacterium]|nr:fructose-bisphosphate aldolase class II [Gammaproteobacteria bacterium]